MDKWTTDGWSCNKTPQGTWCTKCQHEMCTRICVRAVTSSSYFCWPSKGQRSGQQSIIFMVFFPPQCMILQSFMKVACTVLEILAKNVGREEKQQYDDSSLYSLRLRAKQGLRNIFGVGQNHTIRFTRLHQSTYAKASAVIQVLLLIHHICMPCITV